MTRLVFCLIAALATGGSSLSAQAVQDDACARLTRAEAETVLGAAVGAGRVSVHDLATECSYETVGNQNRRTTLAFSVYETGRAGLRGSAASYFAEVRRTSIHRGLPVQSVAVGDEAYWLGGVLYVRKGQDLSLAIEVAGTAAEATSATDSARPLALSTSVATVILSKLDRATATRETLTVATNTQAHRRGLRIAVGNIWEESYTPEGGTPRTGLTALLEVTAEEETSRRRRERVHPGQTLRLFGFVIEIISIERSGVQLTLDRESPFRNYARRGRIR